MMRSLFSGVSGLQNHQTRMDVIGNNVSNVNTTGFKKGRVTFEDMLSQMVQGASKPTEAKGGVNAKQVGLGMTVSSIDNIMTQGSLQTTGKNTDLAVSGEGFFVVEDGENTFYTRNGNFLLDRDGTLVNPNGLRVKGWQAKPLQNGDMFIDSSAPVEDIKIQLGEKIAAKETNTIRLKSNLDMNMPILGENPTEDEILQNTHTTSIDVYDVYGNPRTMRMQFQKNDTNNWTLVGQMYDQDGNEVPNVQISVGEADPNADNTLGITFNTNGTIAQINQMAGNANVQDTGNLKATVTYDLPDGGQGTFDMDLGNVGEVTASVTQFAGRTTTKAYFQDGYTFGFLESFQVDSSGIITGVYDNGVKEELGQVALASFTNAMGLEKAGESLYVSSNNSGMADIGAAGSQGKGDIYAGTLEMSNVDLSETFTDMIITERGFQANSRVITTSDTMLQEILSLKR